MAINIITIEGWKMMTMVTIGGMIGLGKTTLTNLIASEFGYVPFHEDVDDNVILPLFYTASVEEQEHKRYPFLLQLEFLNSRFNTIKTARKIEKSVIDRSIYEDWHFARVNNKIGNIRDEEFMIYEKLLHNMMEELDELPNKAPDLMIYLHASFETVIKRINQRGRGFEQDEGLYNYYYELWSGYNDWVLNHYDKSEVLMIDMDKYDIVQSETDRQEVLSLIENVLNRNILV